MENYVKLLKDLFLAKLTSLKGKKKEEKMLFTNIQASRQWLKYIKKILQKNMHYK